MSKVTNDTNAVCDHFYANKIKKTRISFIAYPLIEVLRKPVQPNKQCRNPRCVYTSAHTYLYGTRGRIVHP